MPRLWKTRGPACRRYGAEGVCYPYGGAASGRTCRVEYGESAAETDELVGNVWARQEGGLTTSCLMSVHLPVKQGETPKEQVDRMFGELNDDTQFNTRLFDFIKGQLMLDMP